MCNKHVSCVIITIYSSSLKADKLLKIRTQANKVLQIIFIYVLHTSLTNNSH